MALAHPFVANHFVAYRDRERVTSLSLAVWLIDAVTGKRPEVEVEVRLKGVVGKPVKNLSGYWCFTTLPEGLYTLVVTSDPVRNDGYADIESKCSQGGALLMSAHHCP